MTFAAASPGGLRSVDILEAVGGALSVNVADVSANACEGGVCGALYVVGELGVYGACMCVCGGNGILGKGGWGVLFEEAENAVDDIVGVGETVEVGWKSWREGDQSGMRDA